MTIDVKKYINDWFIDINIDNVPFSTYIIRNTLLKAISELKVKIHGTVLDLACGVMPYKEYLMNSSIDNYIGMDLEPTQYHNTVKPDLYWDAKRIPLEDSSCDFVIATEFLEHYFDTEHILLEIKRVLKTGGIFFFTVPAIWPLHEVPYDYHRFTPYLLMENFKNASYTSWEIKPLGGYHISFALMLSLWNDNKLSTKRKRLLKPFLKIIIKRLLVKDKLMTFENGSVYSGLYGFVTK
jgi:SAM-dependent methyltransferase